MSKGIVSNRGGKTVVAGSADVVRDKVTGLTGVTITFASTYVFGADGVCFYRNGVLMDKVGAFSGGTGNAEEYQEVNVGSSSTQITLNATDPAVAAELFQMKFIEGIATIADRETAYIDVHPTKYMESIAATTAYKTRVLDSFGQNSDIFCSINSNQLTLSAGKYELEIPVGTYNGANAVSLLVYNISDASNYEEFTATTHSGADCISINTIHMTIDIALAKIFEFRTKAEVASNTEYIGRIKISKLIG